MDFTPGQRLPFEGVANFRDLGGYPSALGGTVRTGRVFRADRLDRMTDADRRLFGALGIRTIFDLRHRQEIDQAPDPFPSVNVCIISAIEEGGHEPLDWTTLQTRTLAELSLRDLYRGILRHAGSEVARIFAGFVDPAGVPAVFHCTAGKDRTGMVAALLLEWLGVPREAILDDYELTNRYRHDEVHADNFDNLLQLGVPPEAAAAMLEAPRWAMAEALHELDTDFGGIEGFLRNRAGLDAVVLAALREQLLV